MRERRSYEKTQLRKAEIQTKRKKNTHTLQKPISEEMKQKQLTYDEQ